MLENRTRITTSPGVSASTSICSKPAAILPSRSCIRNALNAFMSLPVQPDLDALGVQLDVVVEQVMPLRLVPRKTVFVEPAREHRVHALAQLAGTVRRIGVSPPEIGEGAHAVLHLAREPAKVAH